MREMVLSKIEHSSPSKHEVIVDWKQHLDDIANSINDGCDDTKLWQQIRKLLGHKKKTNIVKGLKNRGNICSNKK
jgi:hypothetical protein